MFATRTVPAHTSKTELTALNATPSAQLAWVQQQTAPSAPLQPTCSTTPAFLFVPILTSVTTMVESARPFALLVIVNALPVLVLQTLFANPVQLATL